MDVSIFVFWGAIGVKTQLRFVTSNGSGVLQLPVSAWTILGKCYSRRANTDQCRAENYFKWQSFR
jgi:hypothetical protein